MDVAFFDLDGTLIKSDEGVVKSFQHVLEQFDKPVSMASELDWCVGPPLREVIGRLLETQDAEQIECGVEVFRKRHGEVGLFEAKIYEGIPEMLEQLKLSGISLYIVSSKLRDYIVKTVDHFRLIHNFSAIYGPDFQGNLSKKSDLIAHVLEQEGILPEGTVMIGDRDLDVHGAKNNGVVSIGVTWGYGGRKELTKAGANYLVNTPSEIVKILKTS